jgi:hypothetical protein
MGEFSLSVRLFTLAILIEIRKIAQIFAQHFQRKTTRVSLAKKMDRATFCILVNFLKN